MMKNQELVVNRLIDFDSILDYRHRDKVIRIFRAIPNRWSPLRLRVRVAVGLAARPISNFGPSCLKKPMLPGGHWLFPLVPASLNPRTSGSPASPASSAPGHSSGCARRRPALHNNARFLEPFWFAPSLRLHRDCRLFFWTTAGGRNFVLFKFLISFGWLT